MCFSFKCLRCRNWRDFFKLTILQKIFHKIIIQFFLSSFPIIVLELCFFNQKTYFLPFPVTAHCAMFRVLLLLLSQAILYLKIKISHTSPGLTCIYLFPYIFHNKNEILRDFPHGPMVKSLCFHCKGTGSIPGQGTKILYTCGTVKKRKKGKVRYWEIGIWNNEIIQDNHPRRGFFGPLVHWYSSHSHFCNSYTGLGWNDPKCVVLSLCHNCSRPCLDVKDSKV